MKNSDNNQSIITGVMFFTVFLSLMIVASLELSFGWSMFIILSTTILAGYLTAVATGSNDKTE